MLRAMEINDYTRSMYDYEHTKQLHPNVEFRHLIISSEEISDNLIPLEFSQEQIDRSLELGQKDALSILKSASAKKNSTVPNHTSPTNQTHNSP